MQLLIILIHSLDRLLISCLIEQIEVAEMYITNSVCMHYAYAHEMKEAGQYSEECMRSWGNAITFFHFISQLHMKL